MSWNDLHFKDHPSVCTVLELRGFGEKSVTTNVGRLNGAVYDHADSLEDFKGHLRKIVGFHDEQYSTYSEGHWQNKSVHRTAVIVAYTTDLQPVANSYLAELGFQSSGEIEKLKHPDSKLILWWIKSTDFLKAIEG